MVNFRLVAIAAAVVAAAAVGWLLIDQPQPSPPVAVAAAPTPPPVASDQPPEADIPERVPTPEPLPPLPSLNASDDWLREQSTALVTAQRQPQLAAWLTSSDLLRRASAYLDGLARGALMSAIFPLSPPSDRFISHTSNGALWMNAGNYERYDATVGVISAVDAEQLVALFHRARPLLMAAFSELGYTQRQMDGVVLAALDQILATPVIVEPIELTRESVAFRYADPELESLSRLQKQLLRSGPENTRQLQKLAAQLRLGLLSE